jgi:ubiquinone/menaquinone biosynthesis C-methylase UbiE
VLHEVAMRNGDVSSEFAFSSGLIARQRNAYRGQAVSNPPFHGSRQFANERRAYWDELARATDGNRGWASGYHERLDQVYQFLIPKGMRVLEVGSGRGDLLASLQPSYGVGIDLSRVMVDEASVRHPELSFVCVDVHEFESEEKFDYIILSDLINELWDVQHVFARLSRLCHRGTRLILNTYSRMWDWPLKAASKLGLAHPTMTQNWLTVQDTENLLRLVGFEPLRAWREVLWPVKTPGLAKVCNEYLAKIWPVSHLDLSNFILARFGEVHAASEKPTVSVVVPARNEAGNIKAILERTPEMGGGVELLFVEGHSKDDTYETILREIALHPERTCRVFQQTGKGKGDAVRLGFQEATGDILMILDADMTVPPEDLPRFCEALIHNDADFVNGVRLVYPMEQRAMRMLNLAGNKFFSAAFSWLLGQPVKDTLCGTKVMYARDYRALAANRAYFGDFDPFGDFDLLFGAAKLNLKIVDLPVRYRERTYGDTNIDRFSHGFMLLQMVAFAARRIKFT